MEIVDQLNSYQGDNVWQDVILRLGGYDEAASDAIDQGRSDRFVADGRVFRRDGAADIWLDAGVDPAVRHAPLAPGTMRLTAPIEATNVSESGEALVGMVDFLAGETIEIVRQLAAGETGMFGWESDTIAYYRSRGWNADTETLFRANGHLYVTFNLDGKGEVADGRQG